MKKKSPAIEMKGYAPIVLAPWEAEGENSFEPKSLKSTWPSWEDQLGLGWEAQWVPK